MDRRAILQNLSVSVIERCNAGLDLDGLRREVLPRLRRVVPVDALFFAVTDPATLLHTHRYVEGFPQHLAPNFLENEFHTDDVNKWVELARDKRGVRTLLGATGGRLEDSARYRDIQKPVSGSVPHGSSGPLSTLRSGIGPVSPLAECEAIAIG